MHNYQYCHFTNSEEINAVRDRCEVSKILCIAFGYCVDLLSLTASNKTKLQDAVYYWIRFNLKSITGTC
jgi:hypothetical protein